MGKSKIQFLKMAKAFFYRLLLISPLTGVLIIIALNEYSLSSIIHLWPLILLSLLLIPAVNELPYIEQIKSEVTIFSLAFSSVLIFNFVNSYPVELSAIGRTVFLVKDEQLYDPQNLVKVDPYLYREHFAYFEFLHEWKKTNQPIKAALAGMVMRNQKLYEGARSWPSLFSWWDAKSGPGIGGKYFHVLDMDSGLREAGIRRYLKVPKFNYKSDLRFSERRISMAGKYCLFEVSLTDIKKIEPLISNREKIKMLQLQARLNSKNIKEMRVEYKFNLKCPIFLVFSPALKEFRPWFNRLTQTYKKQMDWDKIRHTFYREWL